MSAEKFFLDSKKCLEVLKARLAEPAPGRIQLLSGPRQVGKTTLLLKLVEHFKAQALYVAADGPEAALPGFWERLWMQVEDLATQTGLAILLLDEIQSFDNWAVLLKGQWDRIRRCHIPIHVVASGSSALHLGSSEKESLAGRFERIRLTHWSAQALAEAFHLPPEEAVQVFVTLGSYPGAFAFRHDFSRFSAYIRDSIIEPAIGRDLLALSAIRRPALLRQLFAVCAISPTQIVSLQKMQGQLQGDGALETLSSYLDLLAEAHLVAPLEKFSKRPLRRRSSPPKLVPLNNALITVMTPGILPAAKQDPARFRVWVENACLAYAWNAGQHVTYFREEPFEVDGILEGSWGQWAVEVKTGKFSAGDLKGLLEFNRLHPDYVPLVVCDPGMEKVAHRIGVQSLSWHQFLLSSSLEKTSVSPMMHR